MEKLEVKNFRLAAKTNEIININEIMKCEKLRKEKSNARKTKAQHKSRLKLTTSMRASKA
jgi:hypothetical protein